MRLRMPAWLLISAVVLSAASARAAQTCEAGLKWPAPDWNDRSAEFANSHHDQIIKLEEYMFKLEGKDEERKGIRTDGLVIVQNGSLIYEKYARGFDKTNRHSAWSVSKSVTGGLVGLAVQQGAITSIDDSICKYVKDKVPEANCNITIKDLMEMSSGLNWNELYEDESNQYSSVLAMLYGEGQKDMAKFVAGHNTRAAPGDLWYYSTGEATLLAAVAQAAMKSAGKDEDWEWTEFFDKIGMNRVTVERDAAGTDVGGSYVFATPRDMAKFGYLYLNNGCWNGTPMLPETWVTGASSPAAAMLANKVMSRSKGEDCTGKSDSTCVQGRNGDIYGQLWWLNRKVDAVGQTNLPWPDVEEGAYAGIGHWGQYLIILPSKHMVIYRTGDDHDEGSLDLNKFISLAQAVGQ